jgi:arsenate reductase (glutaredoxin)
MTKAAKPKVYEYAKCSTCRNALKYLDRQRVEYQRIPIVESPPSLAELKQMLGFVGGEVKRLFNTSGELYRAMGLSAKLGSMSEADALKLLAAHGKLIKRPFVLTKDAGLVGFREEEWKRVF